MLHLSGAGEYIEEALRDEEELLALASDGNGADVLSFALTRHTGILAC